MIQMANNQLSYVASHYILGKVSLAIELKISPFSFFSLTSKTSYSSFFLLPMKIIFGATCCFFLFKLIPLLDLCRQPEFYLELNRKENSEEVRNACMCTHAHIADSKHSGNCFADLIVLLNMNWRRILETRTSRITWTASLTS